MAHVKHIEPGVHFGRLTVQRFSGIHNRHACWECLCECGAMCSVRGSLLRNGTRKQCGHHRKNTLDSAMLMPHRLHPVSLHRWTMPFILSELGVDVPDVYRTPEKGFVYTKAIYQSGIHGGFWMRHEAHLSEIALAFRDAYHRRMREVHPDRPGGSEETAQYVNMLYGRGERLFKYRGIDV